VFGHRAWCQTAASSQAPTEPDKGNIGFFIGATIPTGVFASKSYSDSASGFAKAGVVAGITANYALTEKLSVTGQFSGFSNSVDEASMVKQIAAKNPGFSWTLTSDNWHVQTFLGGVSFALPTDDAEFVLTALMGAASAGSPALILTASKGGLSSTAKVSSANAGAFCYMLGAAIKKNLSPKISFSLTGDFLRTRPQFTNVITSTTNGTSTTSNFYQDISVVRISAALAFRFSKKD
jgi:hypothetical protein